MKIGVLLWEQTEGGEAEMGARNKWSYTNAFSSCSTFGLLFHCAYQRRCGRPFEPSLDLGPGQHTLAFTRSIKQGAGGKKYKVSAALGWEPLLLTQLLVPRPSSVLKWLPVAWLEMQTTEKLQTSEKSFQTPWCFLHFICCRQVYKLGFADTGPVLFYIDPGTSLKLDTTTNRKHSLVLIKLFKLLLNHTSRTH